MTIFHLQQYCERDQIVVDELGNLLERTVQREEKISSITNHLEEELGYLTAFLDNLATRRPKGREVFLILSILSYVVTIINFSSLFFCKCFFYFKSEIFVSSLYSIEQILKHFFVLSLLILWTTRRFHVSI